MSKKTGDYKIPYDKDGNLLEYPGPWIKDVEYRDNVPFDATLHTTGYERGRSAVRVIMTDAETGAKYPMFISDYVDLVTSRTLVKGLVHGTWVGVKKGSNYGLKAVQA